MAEGEQGRGGILAITAAPDDRECTTSLHEIIAVLRRRGIPATIWYLRDDDDRAGPGTRVIDELRTWPVADRLSRIGLAPIAARLRGARLRWWWREVGPRVVVLDDGLGERVLAGAGRDVFRIVRRNDDPTPYSNVEPQPVGTIDLELPPVRIRDYRSAAERSTAASRAEQRRRLSVPDGDLVVGWGDDGWLDGPDVFIRILWALSRRRSEPVHGLWLTSAADASEKARLTAEAERCGLGDRYHLRRSLDPADRWCGDAVCLPVRAPTAPHDILSAVATGLCVVTFRPNDIGDESVIAVDDLDTTAAAAALDDVLGTDRTARAQAAMGRLPDVEPWVDDLLGRIPRIG